MKATLIGILIGIVLTLSLNLALNTFAPPAESIPDMQIPTWLQGNWSDLHVTLTIDEDSMLRLWKGEEVDLIEEQGFLKSVRTTDEDGNPAFQLFCGGHWMYQFILFEKHIHLSVYRGERLSAATNLTPAIQLNL